MATVEGVNPTSTRRRSTGILAIVAAVLAVLIWWTASGNGPQVFQGNAERMGGASGPATPAAGSDPTGGPTPSSPDAVPVDSYVLDGERRLILNYTLSADRCTGGLDGPTVLESEATVVVSLRWQGDPGGATGTCPDAVQRRSLTVDLDSPLGERGLLDGSYSPAVLLRATDRAY